MALHICGVWPPVPFPLRPAHSLSNVGGGLEEGVAYSWDPRHRKCGSLGDRRKAIPGERKARAKAWKWERMGLGVLGKRFGTVPIQGSEREGGDRAGRPWSFHNPDSPRLEVAPEPA